MELSESAPQGGGLLFVAIGRKQRRTSFDVSQETIAQMLGLARETVSRQLAQFRRARVLEWDRTSFVIRDREALEKLVNLPDVAA
jgi:CRP-like cAMP-binding protein